MDAYKRGSIPLRLPIKVLYGTGDRHGGFHETECHDNRLWHSQLLFNMKDVLFLLGAMDPEMEMILSILSKLGMPHRHAMVDGKPVHSGNAYEADPIEYEGTLVFIECAFADGRPESSVVIDHHREGDPGYGVGPDDFHKGSSLGQLLGFLAGKLLDFHVLGWEAFEGDGFPRIYPSRGVLLMATTECWDYLIPNEVVLTMAADHCLGAAYKGQCPGVSPEAMRSHRTRVRSAFQGISPEELETLVASAEVELEKAPEFSPGIKDMRRDTPVPELPEAALRKGIGYISGPLVGKDGRRKFTCSGSREQVEAFIQANPRGLVDVYGDPARGFAGGYEK